MYLKFFNDFQVIMAGCTRVKCLSINLKMQFKTFSCRNGDFYRGREPKLLDSAFFGDFDSDNNRLSMPNRFVRFLNIQLQLKHSWVERVTLVTGVSQYVCTCVRLGYWLSRLVAFFRNFHVVMNGCSLNKSLCLFVKRRNTGRNGNVTLYYVQVPLDYC